MPRPGGEDRGLFEEQAPCKPCDGKRGNDACKKCQGRGKHGNGVWWIRYYEPGSGGKPGPEHRERIGAKSLAREVYGKRKAEIREGKYFPPTRVKSRTVGEAIEEYLETVKGKKHSRNPRFYGRLWREAFGERPLDSVTSAEIQVKQREWLADGSSHATVNHRMNFLRHLFNVEASRQTDEERRRHPIANPVARVKNLKVDNSRVRFLSDEEEVRLRGLFESWTNVALKAVPRRPSATTTTLCPSDWDLVEFAFLTGLRQEEQFTLPWANIDFAHERIRVDPGKNGIGRYVPMHPRVKEILESLPSRHTSEWVWVGARGAQLSPNHFCRTVFRPAILAAKVPDCRWHDLRHTFCSRLVMAGVPLNTVRELAGHKTLAMTQRYSHLAPASLHAAILAIHSAPRTSSASASAPAKKAPKKRHNDADS